MAHYEDLEINQGSDVTILFELVNQDGSKKDLTGHSVAAKMKRNYNSDSDDTVTFGATVLVPAEDGIISLTLTNEETDALKGRAKYVYDVEISFNDSDGNTIIERVAEGKIFVSPSATR